MKIGQATAETSTGPTFKGYWPGLNWPLFTALCGLESSLVIVVLTLYRLTYKQTWSAFLLSLPGMVFCGALVSATLCGGAIIHAWSRGKRGGASSVSLTLVVQSLVLFVAYATAEYTLRSRAVIQIWGEEVHGRVLLPRGWNLVGERYVHMLETFKKRPSYYQEDPHLGWSIGADRVSQDGLFYSSPEGFRSARLEVSYDRSAPCRVALVGDSFTFGEEARFEDTWNYYLQQRLGPNCQTINFAVPGYSIGQMYLRFERDILPHDPDLVILGFTDGALDRTLGIYCFLMGLEWPDCPWVAPRFALTDGQLVVVNAPLPHPREIYATKAIYDLPFIAYDRWYRTSEWEQRHWEPWYASYVFRFLTTLYPIHDVVDPEISDKALQDVNSALFRAFLNLAEQNGLRVLVVYLPMMEDYGYNVRYRVPISHGILKNAGIDFIDGTTCIAQLEEPRRFLRTGSHYTPEGERHLAECLLPHVLKQLPASRSTHGKPGAM